MSSGRPLLRITTSVPDTSYEIEESHLSEFDETHDLWAFRDATLYTFPPPPGSKPGQPNRWTMKIREVDAFNKLERFVELDLRYNDAGEITGVHVQLVDGSRPKGAIAWPFIEEEEHLTEDPYNGKNYKTEFYHCDLMTNLECPTTQKEILGPAGGAMTPARFYVNLVTSLEAHGVVAKFPLEMLADIMLNQF